MKYAKSSEKSNEHQSIYEDAEMMGSTAMRFNTQTTHLACATSLTAKDR